MGCLNPVQSLPACLAFQAHTPAWVCGLKGQRAGLNRFNLWEDLQIQLERGDLQIQLERGMEYPRTLLEISTPIWLV